MKRQPICLVPKDSKRLNVFALMSLDNQLAAYPTEQTTTGAFIAECIENFLTTINKPTVIILDNAPIHRCQPLYERLQDWQSKDLYVFFLPKYSPHLNAIEILWRKIKYEWLKPLHYRTWGTLTKAVKTILTHFGTDYRINFQYTILS
jgi:transposase